MVEELKGQITGSQKDRERYNYTVAFVRNCMIHTYVAAW